LKQLFIIIILVFTIVSCNDSTEETNSKIATSTVKKIAKDSDFGFNFANFNVVQDTIQKGDTFGTIISSQNIGDKRVMILLSKLKTRLMFARYDLTGYLPCYVQKIKKQITVFYLSTQFLELLLLILETLCFAYTKVRPVTV
jgi:hypothetical protein